MWQPASFDPIPRALRRVSAAVLAAASSVSLPVIAGEPQDVRLRREDGAFLPARTYAPASGPAACQGVVVLSHGAGGSERGLAYLGAGLADAGYLVIAPAHQESSMRALRETGGARIKDSLNHLVQDPAAYEARFQDIQAALDWARSGGSCLSSFTVLAGHSMGAATVMMLAGAKTNLLSRSPAPRTRIDAFVALSPQGPGVIFPQDAWSGLQGPVLSVTGTRDDELGGEPWQHRTEPFKAMAPGRYSCNWLAVAGSASHMTLGGRAAGATERQQLQDVLDVVKAFLSGVQARDCTRAAAPWLAHPETRPAPSPRERIAQRRADRRGRDGHEQERGDDAGVTTPARGPLQHTTLAIK